MAIEKGEGGINPEKRSRLSSSHRADHGERNLEKKRWMDFDLSFGNELHLVNEQLLPPPLNSTADIPLATKIQISFPNFPDGLIPKLWGTSIDGNYSLRILLVNF